MTADSTNGPAGRRRVAAVVYNPIKVDLPAIKAVVAEEESAAGWGTTLWFETSEEDPGQGATEAALAEGAEMIIVAGGDGTVRAVAEAVHEHGVTLALLPSGTGNLLARNLKLTLDDLEHSIHSAFTGDDRAIDLGMIEIRRADSSVDRHAYLVMAGLGLDAQMLANTDEELKAKVGWLAYVKAIAIALKDDNQLRIRYKLDGGRSKSMRAHTVIVGNCGTLQANVLLMPDAAVDDGKLDIVLLRPEGFVNWVQVFTKIVWENGVLSRTRLGRKLRTDEVKALNYLKGSRFTLTVEKPELIELDGDEFGEAVAFRTWVEAGGLTVKVPAESSED
ncbi:diacylglycerol kinase family protein [Yonghaparkia sp. Soil809]|uniref:diacylglycerol/lipid kinase family protein n=1 Tax=Yonghaparkia sp. Soil809 TaxID=1736417 RepID=UPI0006F7C754|nr:diacylglycerol kinase family protein [Yonghaparkia sp. Soil809]KRF33456.1 diacylglycerol kinase [Yonghaparkia sp. Soil809]